MTGYIVTIGEVYDDDAIYKVVFVTDLEAAQALAAEATERGFDGRWQTADTVASAQDFIRQFPRKRRQ